MALDSSSGNGSITFTNTLNGSTANSENLTLTSGTGNIDFDGAVGAGSAGSLTINSAGNFTADSTITASSVSHSGYSNAIEWISHDYRYDQPCSIQFGY